MSMIKHKKIYIDYFGYDVGDRIICEVCEYNYNNGDGVLNEAVEIHHISPRGLGGSKLKDYPENLMAICREHHNKAERDKEFNKLCKIIHLKKVIKHIEDE
tara:strand:+ start:347 stop:649 length:303 start_codon:yes stop_codon:yes gene_type:complete